MPSFQRALKRLTTAPSDSLASLANEQDLSAAVTPPPKEMTEGQWQAAVAALRTLYQIARDEGAEAVVADVRRILSTSDVDERAQPALELLPQLLAPRAEFDRRQIYQNARTFALPQVTGVSVTVDFRTVDVPQGDSKRVELVPLLAVRLDFDEHIFGSDSLTVALTEESYESLRQQLDDLPGRYEQVTAELPEQILRPEARLNLGVPD